MDFPPEFRFTLGGRVPLDYLKIVDKFVDK